jgi:hypothetical protein
MTGSRIRGQKNQAFALVALEVASAEDFKISKAKNIEHPGLASGRIFGCTSGDIDRGTNTHARKAEIAFLNRLVATRPCRVTSSLAAATRCSSKGKLAAEVVVAALSSRERLPPSIL